jgi:ferric-dicitrate binding protein FerR (iron transport regulator)
MEIDRTILIRYFSGETSENEKIAIQQWLEGDEAHKRQFIHERIRFDATLVIDEDRVLSIQTGNVRRVLWNTLKIVSIILILAGNGYILQLFHHKQPKVVTQNIHVPPGNRTSLTLPDGTFVWLNSNTTLKYPSMFSGEKRIVELNGEAYFEVIENKKTPFIVKTNKYNVEVLGTTFNVEAYDDMFSTALFTGKVKLYKDQREEESVLLNNGEFAELIDNTLQVSLIESEVYRWRDGLIIIEDKSFEEIMQLFEKYFGQKIIIRNNKVKKLGYRGKLRILDGVDHALRVLQNDFYFTYKRDEETNKIYIY